MEKVLQKLQDLKRVLDRNLNTRSCDILPTINECIKELEQSKQIVSQTPVTTVDKNQITKEDLISEDNVKIEVKTVSEISIASQDIRPAEKTKEQIEYADKQIKQFLKDNGVSNRKFLSGQKARDKAMSLGFILK